MKKIITLFSLVFILISCSSDTEETPEFGKATFSFSGLSNDSLEASAVNKLSSSISELNEGNASSELIGSSDNLIPYAIVVTVQNSNNEIVLETEQLILLRFGADFITEFLELEVGDYQITSFYIINTENETIYASPLESFETSQFVNIPVPLPFTISNEETTTIAPEVLLISDADSPEHFGLPSFNIIETQDLFLAAVEVIDGIETSVEAPFTISIEDLDFTLTGNLESGINSLTLPLIGDDTEVSITITNSNSEEIITQTITGAEANEYSFSTSPLTFIFEEEIVVPEEPIAIEIPDNQFAFITDTSSEDTGELRLSLEEPIAVGMMTVTVRKDVSVSNPLLGAFINLSGTSTTRRNAMIDLEINDIDGYSFTESGETANATANFPAFVNDEFIDIVITWDATVTGAPLITFSIDGQLITTEAFPTESEDITAVAEGVENIQFRLGATTHLDNTDAGMLVDDLMVYDTSTETPTLVFADDFENYTVGNSLDPNATNTDIGTIANVIIDPNTPYSNNSFQVTVEEEN